MTETDEFDVESLTRTLLAGQEEPDDLTVPTVAHWVGLLERRVPLSAQDKAILAISPLSRARHALAAHRYRIAYIERVANRNNIPVMQAAAKSAGRQTSRSAPMKDFKLQSEPSGPTGWLIICDVREGFPSGSYIELVDQEGTVLLSGSPDEEGRIVARHKGVDDPLNALEQLMIRVDGIEIR